MQRFRGIHSLQRFTLVQGSVHSRFSAERTLTDRTTYKQSHTAAVAEWRAYSAD